MPKRIFILITILVLSMGLCDGITPLRGEGGLSDTISYSFHQKPGFFCSFTEYNNFLGSHSTNIMGLQAGLEYNNRVKVGIGYNWLSSQIVRQININDASGSYTTNGLLKFNYWSASFEYIFYNNYPWQFSVPIQLGAGGAHYEYLARTDKSRLSTTNFPVVLLEPSITAQYNVIEWFGIVGGLRYRGLLNSTHELRNDFDTPIYYLKLKLFVDVIYRDLFPNGINKSDKK